MAQSSGRDDADEPAAEAEDPPGRSASTTALWASAQIDPVEIAMPGGVGFTLRAYRPSADISSPEIDRDAATDLDDFDAAAAAVAARRVSNREVGEATDESAEASEFDDLDDRYEASDEESDEESDEAPDETDRDESVDDATDVAEDIPVFLGRRGRLYLFHSPEKLVEFIRSGTEHDMTQLDTWSNLASRVEATDITPRDEDSYELDLVVENLRGGSDVWDPGLILKAGELARDLGYALRIESVLTALSPGSPLDNLDEALRATENGGIGGFFARRKLRKVPAQQSALAWRGIIGRITTAVDWRD